MLVRQLKGTVGRWIGCDEFFPDLLTASVFDGCDVTAGAARREPKTETPPKPARVSSKDLSRYRHKCSMCHAAFTLRTNLTRHIRKAHAVDDCQ